MDGSAVQNLKPGVDSEPSIFLQCAAGDGFQSREPSRWHVPHAASSFAGSKTINHMTHTEIRAGVPVDRIKVPAFQLLLTNVL